MGWRHPGINGASNGGAGTWSTAVANWDTGSAEVVWPGAGNTAVFGGTAGAVALGTPIIADAVNFTTAGYTITTTATNFLTLNSVGTGSSSAIYTSGTGGTDTIAGPITFSGTSGSAQSINASAGDTLTLTGALTQNNGTVRVPVSISQVPAR